LLVLYLVTFAISGVLRPAHRLGWEAKRPPFHFSGGLVVPSSPADVAPSAGQILI
jgi:hypothetical protein